MALTVLLLCAVALLPLTMQTESSSVPSTFRAKQVSRAATIRLNGPLDAAFPLLTPMREKEWAPGWDSRPVWPENGDVVEGMVFTVDKTPGRVFWVVTHYDPSRHEVSYANVLPGQTLNRIEITCASAGSNETDCTVQYAFVGLSDEGNKFVEMHSEEAYAAKMKHWVEAIDHRLKTGKAIEHHP